MPVNFGSLEGIQPSKVIAQLPSSGSGDGGDDFGSILSGLKGLVGGIGGAISGGGGSSCPGGNCTQGATPAQGVSNYQMPSTGQVGPSSTYNPHSSNFIQPNSLLGSANTTYTLHPDKTSGQAGQQARSQSLFQNAMAKSGLKEGDPALTSYLQIANPHLDPQQTPWCAGFVGSVLNSSGLKGTGSLSSKSYLGFGTPTQTPQQGDIVVFNDLSGNNDPNRGHVAFVDHIDQKTGQVYALGGNENNQVTTKPYPLSMVAGFRVPPTGQQVQQTANQMGIQHPQQLAQLTKPQNFQAFQSQQSQQAAQQNPGAQQPVQSINGSVGQTQQPSQAPQNQNPMPQTGLAQQTLPTSLHNQIAGAFSQTGPTPNVQSLRPQNQMASLSNGLSQGQPQVSLNDQSHQYQQSQQAAQQNPNNNQVIKNPQMTNNLIAHFEDFSPKTYWDVNAYRTGYGSDTITRPDGSIVKVQQGMTVNQEDATRDLQRRSTEFAKTAEKQVGSVWGQLPENVQAGLTSVAYNYGSLPSRILPAVKSGDPNRIADAVATLKNDNKGVNYRRRMQESAIIRGDVSNMPKGVPMTQNSPQDKYFIPQQPSPQDHRSHEDLARQIDAGRDDYSLNSIPGNNSYTPILAPRQVDPNMPGMPNTTGVDSNSNDPTRNPANSQQARNGINWGLLAKLITQPSRA